MTRKYPFLFVIILVLGLSAAGRPFAQQTTAPASQNNEKKSAADKVKAGMDAYRSKDYAKAAQLLQEAVAGGVQEPGVLYDTACALVLAGEKEKAFQFLNRATQSGFRNSELMKSDSDLTSLRDDPRWAKMVAASDEQQAKYLKEHSDPKKARFITTDIARFWKTYDKARAAATPEERIALFQSDYIEPGSIGLKDFSRSGRLNAKTLTKTIETHENFFKTIRPTTLDIETQRAETVAAFRKLKEIYPQALFPDVYFVIGQLQSGGTASDNGLLMGAEMFTRSPGLPTGELGDWEKGVIMEQSEIPPLIAHESIHFQQKYPAQSSLLCACLKEGSADFIGEMISGRMITRMQQTHTWANARERQLWEEFQKEMDGKNTSNWLYGSSGKNGRPVDLGYWMGYKISEAYYKNAADKKQAIRNILMVKDCKEFLKASRYAEKFPVPAADSKGSQ